MAGSLQKNNLLSPPLMQLPQINWPKVNNLLPAIIQDSQTKEVLMLGYMNQEALALTLKTNQVTFFSRTRQCLWTKGKNSRNYLNIVDVKLDCDGDALLIKVNFSGIICHTGTKSCFFNSSL